MSEARIRGKPTGDTAAERIAHWLDRAPNVGEGMTWVGKDYSLAQLKTDVRELHAAGKGIEP